MVLVLSILGLIAAVWTWQNVHPVAGVVVGVLFVGGSGWRLIGVGLRSLRPSARQAFGPEGRQFIAAWEERFGDMRSGPQPPPGIFQAWLKTHRQTQVAAGDWIDRQLGLPTARDSNRVQRALRGGILAECQIPALLPTEPGYPVMTLTADSNGLAVHNKSGTLFFEFDWSDIGHWWRGRGSDGRDASVWVLFFDGTAGQVPAGVTQLSVWDPNKPEQWRSLLQMNVPEDGTQEV